MKILQLSFLILIVIKSFIYETFTLNLLYSNKHSTITVFTEQQQQLVLQIDFLSSSMHLPSALKTTIEKDGIYLSRHKKNKIKLKKILKNSAEAQDDDFIKKNLVLDFVPYQKEFRDKQKIIISGKIGLSSQNNIFMELLKLSNDQDQIKIDLDNQNNDMKVIFQKCYHPIKLPLLMRIQGKKEIDVPLTSISNEFYPDKDFLHQAIDIIEKQHSSSKDEFFVSVSQFEQRSLKLIINGKQRTIQLKQLLQSFCHKISSEMSYKCRVKKSQSQATDNKISYGQLLSYFNLSICNQGIQIHGQTKEQQTYYTEHILSLFFILIAVIFYQNDEFFVGIIKKILKKRKNW